MLLGPSGSGKSTLLNILGGLDVGAIAASAQEEPSEDVQRLLVATLAACGAAAPSGLVADEIISMLDASTRIDVLNLLGDLKQRGLLDHTLVVWCTEFGRMPTFQKGAQGRDHNPNGFTCWLAGAGVKKGFTHGATDEFGYRAVQDVVSVHDFHATLLHLLGIDHERLTYYHNGLERRLTDVHGSVVNAVLA